jgi:pimeloyl-ACP methyl ester carboxylesterase
MLAGADITRLLSHVRVPTLVIAPSRSPLTSLADQITIRNSIPDARISVVESPGHETYVDEPEQCISALLRFLGSLYERNIARWGRETADAGGWRLQRAVMPR